MSILKIRVSEEWRHVNWYIRKWLLLALYLDYLNRRQRCRYVPMYKSYNLKKESVDSQGTATS